MANDTNSINDSEPSSISAERITFAEKPSRQNFRDLDGLVFGEWKVLGYAGINKSSKAVWWCECKCGTLRKVVGRSLLIGKSISCDCHRRQLVSSIKSTHGHTKNYRRSPEYRTWRQMKSRCLNPNCQDFKHYSDRGIYICGQWIDSFENFLNDMGSRPSPKHTLERKDNDGPYSPGNCRWATRLDQALNRRTSVMVTAFGETRVSSQWSREFHGNATTVTNRLRSGWCAECSIKIPIRGGTCAHKA